jgi:hypothetical protein
MINDIEKYFESLEEESKTKGFDGYVNYAYCYGVVKAQLDFALMGGRQLEIVQDNIKEEIENYTKQLELNI